MFVTLSVLGPSGSIHLQKIIGLRRDKAIESNLYTAQSQDAPAFRGNLGGSNLKNCLVLKGCMLRD